MTHSTSATERESGGSTERVYHTIDITSLDSAGAESYDPDAELGVSVEDNGIDVVGQENTGYLVRWDHLNSQLTVVNVSDGTNVASGTDVGEVVLCVDGV